MTYDPPDETPVAETGVDFLAQRPRSERAILTDLVRALAPHAGGLRRWSVMRAIRTERERGGRDVSQKFEADIERVFRRYCAGTESGACKAADALFFRPAEKAGEVWAVMPGRAKAWLQAESVDAA
jgi:hypothetical protein